MGVGFRRGERMDRARRERQDATSAGAAAITASIAAP
jgi:hypothetical protein